MSREERVTELLKPVVESMGFEWVGVEYHHNSVNAILRIYVDRPEGGIDMEGVVEVTEAVNPILDVEDPINAPYTLELPSLTLTPQNGLREKCLNALALM